MLVQCAAEAEVVTAFAMYAWDCTREVSCFDVAVDGVHAVWRGAPLQILEVVDIGSCEELIVSVPR